jgi:hypothetical protein
MTGRSRNAPAAVVNVPEFVLETKFQELNVATADVYAILEEIVTAGAQILYTRYIESQKVPYASRTLARELVLNASWTSIPLDCREIFAVPDDDLTLPPIDEWAGGVLPVRNTEATSLRCSVTPQRDLRKSQTLRRTLPSAESQGEEAKQRPKAAAPPRQAASRNQSRPPTVVVISEAERITKAFEEARKRTNSAMKAITVDSDFTVIQISEPKGLPPALIVPKVAAKSRPAARPVATVPTARQRRPVASRNEPKKRRQPPPLLQPDVPVFDEEVAAISYSDRFVCAPGVTFKDGTTVKNRPQVSNPAQMTRTQYEAYLQEMMQGNGP